MTTFVIKTTGVEDYLAGGAGRIKVLVMGPPGVGKTRSASFWPKPLLLDCEDGRMSVADRSIPFGEIESTSDMDEALKAIERDQKLPKAQRKYETVIIDTLDAFQTRVVIPEILDGQGKEAMSGWSDWGLLDAQMNKLIARLHKLDVNVVCNLHVKETKVGADDDGKGGIMVAAPKLKGDFRDQITADFDWVGYMATYYESDGQNGRVEKRGITWHATPDRPVLKDRSGQLPRWTPVNFDEGDYLTLQGFLAQGLEGLTAGEIVESIETAAGPAPVAPHPGGPVPGAAVPPAAAKKAAAKKATAPKAAAPAAPAPAPASTAAPAPAASTAVPVPAKVAAPPAAAKPPMPEAPAPVTPPATPEEAEATVTEVLDAEAVPNEPVEVVEASPAEEVAATDVPEATFVEPEVVEAEVVDEPADDGVTGTLAVECGSPWFGQPEDFEPVAGCGQVLANVEPLSNSIIDVLLEGQNLEVIGVSGVKTRTFLCNGCFATYRKK